VLHEGIRDIRTIEEQISHCAVAFRHLPVVYRDLGCLHLLPLWQAACVKILDLAGVCDDGFLFEISYKSVDGTRAQEVGKE
jgi:hypothetical protein